jgi:hypothetical protein
VWGGPQGLPRTGVHTVSLILLYIDIYIYDRVQP